MDCSTRTPIEKLLNSISTDDIDTLDSPPDQIALALGVELLKAAYLRINVDSIAPTMRSVLWDVRKAVSE